MTELEKEILCIIESEMESEYIGTLKVIEDPNFYELILHMNREYVPLHLGCQGTKDDFKKFIKEEFHIRKGSYVKYWKCTRENIVDQI